ncbi:MAG: 5-formyltetrahydrofolate cyclo-ligase [Clostridia bacterium]|nr:5-formyltetrahydrofolate cyclo-ligase [Clostridia bacterium]
MTPKEQKAAWRKKCATLRSNVSPKQKALDDAALCAYITAHPAFSEADLILSFFAVRGEPELSPLFSAAQKRGIPVAFPRCVEKDMFFHTVKGLNELSADKFGIPAPAADAPLARPTAKTLCLLPGLAAGRDGSRLGYGGGFYDRFLATFGGITLFPVYERLVFDTLPTDAFDRKVDHILTEKGELTIHG